MNPIVRWVVDISIYTAAFVTGAAAFGVVGGMVAALISCGYGLICYIDGMQS